MTKTFEIWFDGACQRQRMGCGTLIKEWTLPETQYQEAKQQTIYQYYYSPDTTTLRPTNNLAEYLALKRGLIILHRLLQTRIRHTTVDIYGDSQLVIYQLKGIYECKSDNLKQLYEDCKSLMSYYGEIKLTHVRRESNEEADELSKRALEN